MNTSMRKTLIAGSIAAALSITAASSFAQTEKDRAYTEDKAKQGMHDRMQSQPEESTLRGNSGKVVTQTTESVTSSDTRNTALGEVHVRQDLKSYVYTLSPDDLEGTKVLDRDGKDVGKIKSVVATRDNHRAYAIVAVGGMLGVGARDILVPFSDLSREGNDNLQVRANLDEIGDWATYEKETHQRLKGDAPVNESMVADTQSVSSAAKPSKK